MLKKMISGLRGLFSRRCPCCERLRRDVKRRARNTSYVDDELNWLVSCLDCYQEDYEYYAELWRDYYHSRL